MFPFPALKLGTLKRAWDMQMDKKITRNLKIFDKQILNITHSLITLH